MKMKNAIKIRQYKEYGMGKEQIMRAVKRMKGRARMKYQRWRKNGIEKERRQNKGYGKGK